MNLTLHDFENTFYDFGCFDLLSQKDIISDYREGLFYFSKFSSVEEKQSLLNLIVNDILSAGVSNLEANDELWIRKVVCPKTATATSRSIEFIDTVFHKKYESEEILLCSSTAFDLLKSHPKASAGIENTYHVFGNRLIRMGISSSLALGILVPKGFIYLSSLDSESISFKYKEVKTVKVFSMEELIERI